MLRSLVTLLAVPMVASEVAFDEYLRQFGKAYKGEEYSQRRALFEERVAQHAAQNSRGGTWKAGVNEFTDQSDSEMEKLYGYNKAMSTRFSGQGALATMTRSSLASDVELEAAPPESVDWRKRDNILTPVKSQGACGSCWAVAATEAIESNIAIETGKLLSLSPQGLTSCVSNPRRCGGDGGCHGATSEMAFNHTMRHGIAEIWQYPYVSGVTGKTETCNGHARVAASIESYKVLEANNARALMKAVSMQPVVVNVDASPWYKYQSGIFDGCDNTKPDINHAVLLVGYGIENGTKYWTIRNSWGIRFGEDGYIRLKRYDEEPCGTDPNPLMGFACAADGANQVIKACGECGVLADSTYPTGGRMGGPRPVEEYHPDPRQPDSGGNRRLRSSGVNWA